MISSLPFCPSPRQLSSVHGDEEGRLQRGVEHSLARSATGGAPLQQLQPPFVYILIFIYSSFCFVGPMRVMEKDNGSNFFGGDRAFLLLSYACPLISFVPFDIFLAF